MVEDKTAMKIRHKSTRLKPQRCKSCGKKIDAASHFAEEGRDPAEPKPGAINICIYCNTVTVFDENLMLRDPTPSEMIAIANDPEVMKLSYVVGKAIQERKRRNE